MGKMQCVPRPGILNPLEGFLEKRQKDKEESEAMQSLPGRRNSMVEIGQGSQRKGWCGG